VLEALGDGSWEVRGLSRSGRRPACVACDLTVAGAPAAQVAEFRPHVVVHLAAEWRPDVLRRSPARARRLNVDASGALAAACERSGAWLIYVSADCVFDGRSPPYTVDSMTNPLSEYGWHKLHGEHLTSVACPRAAILRVPLLYGPVDSVVDSAVTSLYADLRSGVKEVDAWQRCYPTWTGDVAGVIRAMMDLHRRGEQLRGVFHWQGIEHFTWHEMMLLVADTCGLDASSVRAVHTAPSVALPKDTRLDCSRLEGLIDASRLRTSFRDGLRVCLAPFRCTPTVRAERELRWCRPRRIPDESDDCHSLPEDPEKQFREELRARGAALQELFWQELERTRNRLREAGFAQGRQPAEEPRAVESSSKPISWGAPPLDQDHSWHLPDGSQDGAAGERTPCGPAEGLPRAGSPLRAGSPPRACRGAPWHLLSEQRV